MLCIKISAYQLCIHHLAERSHFIVFLIQLYSMFIKVLIMTVIRGSSDEEGFCFIYFLQYLKTFQSRTFNPSFPNMCTQKQLPLSRFRKKTFIACNHSQYLFKYIIIK